METVTIAGARIEVLRIPASLPDRPTLLLLHEGLGCVALWKRFPHRLADETGCEVVAYSRRGYGMSDPLPLPWPILYMHGEAEFLSDVLDALGLERIVAVGHSDGASIAIIAAGSRRFPGLEALVLESPHVFTEEHGLTEIRKAGIAYRETDLRDRLAQYHDKVDVAFLGWHDAWTHSAFVAWNLEGFLPAIDVPVLLVQEADDPYGTLAQLDAIEARVAGPVERLVLAGDGHSPHRSQPGAVVAAIVGFLETTE
ncbi:benzoate degradation ring-cleavage hydrolase [hydrothermal vent metagenome]|uniref:Benzoate degradation ring-cleavage hydrolase n=1 Tax=hydrothermal vent metagenome TaxID=652676 RepID=A0A3B0RHA4_9ZZZZ